MSRARVSSHPTTRPPASDPDSKALDAFESAIAHEGEWRARVRNLRALLQGSAPPIHHELCPEGVGCPCGAE